MAALRCLKEEKGSAIAMVLMILAVLSMMGAGLMLQTQYDLGFTSSLDNSDRIAGLADGAAAKAVKSIPRNPPVTQGTDPIVAVDPVQGQLTGFGNYQYSLIYVSKAPAGSLSGYEVSGGGYGSGRFYPTYWLAEGTGWKAGRPETRKEVQMPVVYVTRE